MADPEQLRKMAERLLAVAIQGPDEEIARELTARASEYLDQAAALEAAQRPPEEPERVAREADEPQPNERKK
jgi:hypothetical protein